ncbi:MAG TPA: flagellar hook-basal body complex protein [Microvirga sp.]|jgi:flagellar hook protein FlgE|nr:flagellar hook-basal body complex protein [Microvirga sp.]
MGLFGALTTAVSGLRAQSYAMQNISGNISNSQTPGFKRVDTSFVDMVPELPYRSEVAGSVNAFSKLTNTIKGDPLSTSVSTNVAISGEGFFMVQERVGYAGNQPVFGNIDYYTRRGDFEIDKDGYLHNGAGFYLRGSSINPVTGDPTGTGMIQISNAPVPAKQTTQIVYKANLPKVPATTSGNPLFGPSGVGGYEPRHDPNALPPVVTTGFVRNDDTNRFLSESVSGGSVTVYDASGQPINVEMRWAKVRTGDPLAGPPTPDVWNLFYLENSNPAAPATPTWRNIGGAFEFNASGILTAPVPATVNIPALMVNGAPLGGALTMDFGVGGLTQYNAQNGLVRGDTISQDGYSSGVLDSVAVEADGRVVGSYTNGRVLPVAQITIAQFNADNALKRLDKGVYEQTLESGLPVLGLNGASLIGGHVEGSNTDIAEEFSKMIVTQQAYSANTRVVSTSQQMMSEIVNMIR